MMSATSLKLPAELKQRIVALVDGTHRTAHAFMVEAIEQATHNEELRRRFGVEAAAAERETMKTGRAYDALEVFNYLEARSHGTATRKPRQKAWRKSA